MASQRSITANLRPLNTHIYHVVIIMTGGFSKKSFLLLFSRNSFEKWTCFLRISAHTIGVISFAWSQWICCGLWAGHYFSYFVFCICSTSAAHTIGVIVFAQSQYIGCWLWTGHCSGYLFSALFAKQILIFFMSVAYMSPVPSPVHLWCVGSLGIGHCSGFVASGIIVN